MKIERITPILTPGWDCIYGQHCEFSGQRDNGRNHGIHGDEYHYGVRTELADGRYIAVSLTLYTQRYPATVPASHWAGHRPPSRHPFAASIDFHLQLAIGETSRPSALVTRADCEFLGAGRHCQVIDSGALEADRIYRSNGIPSDAPSVDLTQQPDALYNELIDYMKRRIGVIT